MLDALAATWDISLQSKFNALIGSGLVNGQKTELAKPLTFMNRSGSALKQVVSYFKVETSDIIVVHDDIDLEFGQIKLNSAAVKVGITVCARSLQH